MVARWWFDHYERKHRPGHVFAFADFLTGNLGMPRDAFLAAGGFDDAFVGCRREDYELGCRLLAAGVPFRAAPGAVARHHHLMTPRKVLRDRVGEGYGDVLLALRHPAVYRDMPLIRKAWPTMVGSLWWRVDVAVGRLVAGRAGAAVNAYLGGLERGRRRHRWAAILGRLAGAAYRAGVQKALDDGHVLPSPNLQRTEIDLDGDAPIEPHVALGEVTFRMDGEELGYVLAPDGQWDVEEIVRRAVDGLAMQALVASKGAGRS